MELNGMEQCINGRNVDLNWDTKWYSEVNLMKKNGCVKLQFHLNPFDIMKHF